MERASKRPRAELGDTALVSVVYHYPCPDGAFGALAASLGLARPGDDSNTRWLPMTVFGTEQERLAVASTFKADEAVFIVDFFGGASFVRAACDKAATVVVLDHHKTAAAQLASGALTPRPSNLEVVMDMEKSGAAIARDHFHLGPSLDPELGRLFDLVEDNDLWRHQLPDSKLFSAGFKDLGLELDVNKNPGLFEVLAALKADDVIERGREAIRKTDLVVACEVATAVVVKLPCTARGGEARCLAVRTEHPDNRSTLGHVLATRSAAAGLDPVGVVFYVEPAMGEAASKSYKVSFRSTNGYDVAALASEWGGGGHAAAASCNVPKASVEGWRDDAAFRIRRFAGDSDLAAVLEVCLTTGDAGADASAQFPTYPKLLGTRWVAPYCEHARELAFVLEDDVGVCGYVLGALDSAAFYAKARVFLADAAAEYPVPPAATKAAWSLEEKLQHELHNPTMHLPEELHAEYPSHLHIDLSPRSQGRRMGGKMMATLLGQLQTLGSAGVHLEMAPENARALRFYTKLGFNKLVSPPGVLYLGLKLDT